MKRPLQCSVGRFESCSPQAYDKASQMGQSSNSDCSRSQVIPSLLMLVMVSKRIWLA